MEGPKPLLKKQLQIEMEIKIQKSLKNLQIQEQDNKFKISISKMAQAAQIIKNKLDPQATQNRKESEHWLLIM